MNFLPLIWILIGLIHKSGAINYDFVSCVGIQYTNIHLECATDQELRVIYAHISASNPGNGFSCQAPAYTERDCKSGQVQWSEDLRTWCNGKNTCSQRLEIQDDSLCAPRNTNTPYIYVNYRCESNLEVKGNQMPILHPLSPSEQSISSTQVWLQTSNYPKKMEVLSTHPVQIRLHPDAHIRVDFFDMSYQGMDGSRDAQHGYCLQMGAQAVTCAEPAGWFKTEFIYPENNNVVTFMFTKNGTQTVQARFWILLSVLDQNLQYGQDGWMTVSKTGTEPQIDTTSVPPPPTNPPPRPPSTAAPPDPTAAPQPEPQSTAAPQPTDAPQPTAAPQPTIGPDPVPDPAPTNDSSRKESVTDKEANFALIAGVVAGGVALILIVIIIVAVGCIKRRKKVNDDIYGHISEANIATATKLGTEQRASVRNLSTVTADGDGVYGYSEQLPDTGVTVANTGAAPTKPRLDLSIIRYNSVALESSENISPYGCSNDGYLNNGDVSTYACVDNESIYQPTPPVSPVSPVSPISPYASCAEKEYKPTSPVSPITPYALCAKKSEIMGTSELTYGRDNIMNSNMDSQNEEIYQNEIIMNNDQHAMNNSFRNNHNVKATHVPKINNEDGNNNASLTARQKNQIVLDLERLYAKPMKLKSDETAIIENDLYGKVN